MFAPMRLRKWRQHWLGISLAGLFLSAMFVPLFTLSMHRGLSHDEHQFIASAVLVAREHLEPYRDFAYFHVPNQTYLWALFYHFTDYYLLIARLFCVVCGWLLLVVIFAVGWQLWRDYPNRIRLSMAAGAVICLVASPSFSYTSGRAWNHDLPILLTLVAFLVHVHGLRHPGTFWFWFSGLLVGFAAASRLSFAPAVLPFILIIWLLPPQNRANRLRCTCWFGLGLIVGTSPALYSFGRAPSAFIFGNLEYAQLNTLYRVVNEYEKGMTASSKLKFIGVDLLLAKPGNLLLLAAYLGLGLPRLRRRVVGQSLVAENLELTLIALILLAFIPGAIAPTPPWPQYFYPFFPFFVVGALIGLRTMHPNWVKLRQFWLAELVALGLVTGFAFDEYRNLLEIVKPATWFPLQLHQDSQQLADLLNVKRDAAVLTVSPAAVLEGNLQIYPEFVNGPFAVRAGTFLSPAQQAAYKLVAPNQLDAWLGKKRPDAILTGFNARDSFDETSLVDFAKRQQYTPIPLGKGAFLWANPLVEWGGAIRLGTYSWREQPLMPGTTWPLMLYLENVAPIKHNLNITLRIVDASGHEWVHDQGWPWGRPTRTWPRHDIWFDGHQLTMPPDAPAGIYRVDISFFDPETQQLLPAVDLRQRRPINDAFVLGYVSVGRQPTVSQPLSPALELGHEIKLLGTDLAANTTVARGSTLKLRLDWQAMRALYTDYTIFVHLISPDGKLVAQQDKQPLDGFFPTSRWLPDQSVVDNYQLSLPPDAPLGPSTLQVGLYNLANGQRLPMVRDGKTIGDAVTIATVEVK